MISVHVSKDPRDTMSFIPPRPRSKSSMGPRILGTPRFDRDGGYLGTFQRASGGTWKRSKVSGR